METPALQARCPLSSRTPVHHKFDPNLKESNDNAYPFDPFRVGACSIRVRGLRSHSFASHPAINLVAFSDRITALSNATNRYLE